MVSPTANNRYSIVAAVTISHTHTGAERPKPLAYKPSTITAKLVHAVSIQRASASPSTMLRTVKPNATSTGTILIAPLAASNFTTEISGRAYHSANTTKPPSHEHSEPNVTQRLAPRSSVVIPNQLLKYTRHSAPLNGPMVIFRGSSVRASVIPNKNSGRPDITMALVLIRPINARPRQAATLGARKAAAAAVQVSSSAAPVMPDHKNNSKVLI